MGFNKLNVFLNLKSLKIKTIKNYTDHILGDTIIKNNFP